MERWREKLKDYIRITAQILSYLVITPQVRVLFGAKRVFPEDWHSLKRGILFVSNHQSKIDPFVVLSYLPFKLFLQLLPIHFPVNHRDYQRYYFKPLLKLVGGYDIGGTKKEKLLGLMRTRHLLKNQKTVFLFPEGEINRETMGEFQPGIEFLARDSQGVVFVRMRGFGHYRDVLARGKSLLKFSKVYSIDALPANAEELKAFVEQL